MAARNLTQILAEHHAWATSDTPRIPLGWKFFDQATNGGIARGEVLMMLAYSGVGKSWWAGNVVLNNPTIPVVFFQLEMQARALAQRLAATYCQVPTSDIENRTRELGTSPEMAKLTADFPLLSIEDQPGMSLRQMAEQMDNYAETMSRRPEMVFIDYLELVRAGPALGPGEAVDKVSRALKDFSREHDVALIVLHQTNAMESSRIRNSGSKVQDNGHLALTRRAARYGGDVAADYTVGCYRPALDPEMAEHIRAMADPQFMMQLLKNRGGSQLYLTGVEHHVDTRFWKISERQAPIEEPHARHQGAWQP